MRESRPDPLAGVTVLIVSDFAHVNGGAAQVAIQSAVGLRHRGVNVTFAYASGPIDERLKRSGITCIRLPLEEVWSKTSRIAAAVEGIWNRTAATLMESLLARYDRRHTLVHFHQWTKCLSPSVIAASLALDFKTIVTAHDYFLACPNGALYNFNSAQPCSLRPMTVRCFAANCDSRSRAHKLVRVARQYVQGIQFSGLANQPTIIHVSDFARELSEPLMSIPGTHTTVINPVQVQRLSRATPESNSELLYVGRLVPEKGCVDFARAAHRVGMPVAFAGSGSAEKSILAANPSARILGWVPPADLRAVVRRSRALVFPSRWNETSGLVCYEALADGIPVIASRRTAAARQIENGVNSLLIDPDDCVGFDKALSLLTDDERVSRMSQTAYLRYWAAPVSVDRHVEELTKVYEDALSEDVGARFT